MRVFIVAVFMVALTSIGSCFFVKKQKGMRQPNLKEETNDREGLSMCQDDMGLGALITGDEEQHFLQGVARHGYEIRRIIHWDYGLDRYLLLELVRTAPFQGMRWFVRSVAFKRRAFALGYEKIFDHEESTFSGCPYWVMGSSFPILCNENGREFAVE